MRTLNVCLLASSISFNALAADISRVVDNYDGQQSVHKYLKNVDTNTAFEAIPLLVEKNSTSDRIQDEINLETILLANSRKVKNDELKQILRKAQSSYSPYKSQVNFRNWLYTLYPREKYTIETQVSDDNTISCIMKHPNGEEAFTITDFSLTDNPRIAEIDAENQNYHFDDETSYFLKQSILKEAARISKNRNIIDFSQGANKSNTVIAVDFDAGIDDDQKTAIYEILLHYTMPGILNKVNVENFRDLLTNKLLNEADKDFFNRFLSHQHFIDLTQKSDELRDLRAQIMNNITDDTKYTDLCENMIDSICDRHLLLYNNYIISAYLHALGGVNKVLFIPKTLYQLITVEGLMHNDAYRDYDVNVLNASYHPTFRKVEVSNHADFIKILSIANERAIKQVQNRGINSIIFKLIRSMQKSKYISDNLAYTGDYWSTVIRSTAMRPLIFSDNDSYTSLNFYKMISKIITKEYNTKQFTWRVYHGGNKCKITNGYSTSFSDGLFSGCIYDSHSGCAATYAFKRNLFHCDINFSMPNTNFYIPAEHTILPMFGKGELHHVRTKIYKNVDEYKSYHEIPGFAFNFEEKAGIPIRTIEYPMIFTEDPDEFRAVTVYHIKNLDTYIANYTRYHIY